MAGNRYRVVCADGSEHLSAVSQEPFGTPTRESAERIARVCDLADGFKEPQCGPHRVEES